MTDEDFTLLTFSDWRVQEFEPLQLELKERSYDFVLYGGDDTTRFGPISGNLEGLLSRFDDDPEIPDFYRPRMGYRTIYSLFARNMTRSDFKKQAKKHLKQNEIFLYPRTSALEVYKNGSFHFKRGKGKTSCLFVWEGDEKENHAEAIASLSRCGLGAVIGNDCSMLDKLRLVGNNVYDLHDEPVVIDDIGFMGLQGASVPPGIVLYEEEDALKHLENQWVVLEKADVKRRILLTHAPPRNILDYSIRFDIGNIGSTAVRDFIQSHDVDLVVCGHSHLNGGRMEKLENTIVVNIASHDDWNAKGRIARITVPKKGEVDVEFSELEQFIGAELTKLPQVGMKRIQQMRELGITTLDDVKSDKEHLLAKLPGASRWHARLWILSAEAYQTGESYRVAHKEWGRLERAPHLVMDIETDLKGMPWCIGVWDPDSNTVKQFHNPDDQAELLDEFFSFVNIQKQTVMVSFSGSRFDKRNIIKVAEEHSIEVPHAVKNEIDVGILAQYHCIGLPHFDLKGLAVHFGYKWTNEDMSGLQAGILADKYYRTGEAPDWEMLLDYNRDDVLATKLILEKLLEMPQINDE